MSDEEKNVYSVFEGGDGGVRTSEFEIFMMILSFFSTWYITQRGNVGKENIERKEWKMFEITLKTVNGVCLLVECSFFHFFNNKNRDAVNTPIGLFRDENCICVISQSIRQYIVKKCSRKFQGKYYLYYIDNVTL